MHSDFKIARTHYCKRKGCNEILWQALSVMEQRRCAKFLLETLFHRCVRKVRNEKGQRNSVRTLLSEKNSSKPETAV